MKSVYQKGIFVFYLDCKRWCGGVVSINRLPIFINQELGKVPLNISSKDSIEASFQELVNWCSIVTVYINLCKNSAFFSQILKI